MKILRIVLFVFILFVANGNHFAQIYDIKEFLNECPTSDPLIDTVLKDFQFRLNDQIITDFPCTEPISEMSVEQYTQPLIYLQTMRTIFYMDRAMDNHLPWTDTTLYVWMKDRVDGIRISDDWPSGGYCCDVIDGKRFVVVSNANESNREFDKKWQGISGNVGFVAHEVRHLDGSYYHTDCCVATSCDSTYDEENLSCFGVQYWLEKAWLSGFINVGAKVSHTDDEITDIVNWHLESLNGQFRERFCFNAPDEVDYNDFENLLGTAVSKINYEDISLFPNPSSDAVFIKSAGQFPNVEVGMTDLLGHTVLKLNNIDLGFSGDFKINTAKLPRGFYLITLKIKDQSLNYKFFKE